VATFLPITLGQTSATLCTPFISATDACAPGTYISVYNTTVAGVIFNNTAAKDARDKLAGQLLASKLGIAAATGNGACLATVITLSDAAITTFGYNSPPAQTGFARTLILDLATRLENWNRTGTCLP
jgi:hypothetical protein